MRCNKCRDRLGVNAGVAQWEGDDGRCACDFAQRIGGNCAELTRGGDTAQGWGDFARRKTRD